MGGGVGKEEERRGEERIYMILTEERTDSPREKVGEREQRELLAFAFALAWLYFYVDVALRLNVVVCHGMYVILPKYGMQSTWHGMAGCGRVLHCEYHSIT